ncbi:hypothetical protein C4K68_13575 [Pokkaliibacter plantistimulans]|uniref:Uncharacterized protein n=1 Tax=Proteobacteria bacterium 228 TaxID=2083153 RepID=A0A2S5KQ40_9PROT|nr:hypothetical protein [Pokkaliibacter plantistimulans]PPC76860.1 hypothetical protein C4K68_13575 [Pokkaliibacter plantistimulans]
MKTSSSSPSASPYSSSVEGNYSQHTKGKHKAGVLHKLGKWLGASSSANSSAANKPLSASQLAAYPNAISTPANRYNDHYLRSHRQAAEYNFNFEAHDVPFSQLHDQLHDKPIPELIRSGEIKVRLIAATAAYESNKRPAQR